MRIDIIDMSDVSKGELIMQSAMTGIPILCKYPALIMYDARQRDIDIPDPISYDEVFKRDKDDVIECYIEDLEWFLEDGLGIKCKRATVYKK